MAFQRIFSICQLKYKTVVGKDWWEQFFCDDIRHLENIIFKSYNSDIH